MDTLGFWFLVVGMIVGGIWVWSDNHMPTPAPREYPALCRDPFTSRDMRETTYTYCKLVPMWSTKA